MHYHCFQKRTISFWFNACDWAAKRWTILHDEISTYYDPPPLKKPNPKSVHIYPGTEMGRRVKQVYHNNNGGCRVWTRILYQLLNSSMVHDHWAMFSLRLPPNFYVSSNSILFQLIVKKCDLIKIIKFLNKEKNLKKKKMVKKYKLAISLVLKIHYMSITAALFEKNSVILLWIKQMKG